MVPRKILVATDGSQSAIAAEKFAAGMADLMGECEVVVVTVVRERERPARAGGSILPDEKEMQEAQGIVDAAVARIEEAMTGNHAKVRSSVLHSSSPAIGIVEAAHEGGSCSLIVMGNRGHGHLSSLIIGSVSDQVLHEAHCPTLIVKT